MQTIAYVYADDTTHSLTVLGKAHQWLCATPPAPSKVGLLLHTCQRIEWYSRAQIVPPAVELLGHVSTPGARGALVRLAQIAAGSRSLIPGESFIHRQVYAAFTRLMPDHPLYGITREALLLATRAREEFSLSAKVDYSDLPTMLFTPGPHTPRQLLIIGGGMLARAVAAAPPPGYDHVVMWTRGPRKLRRVVEGLSNVSVVRHPSLARVLNGKLYDTVIATTNLHGDYLEHVLETITAPQARRVLDLCATPALTDRPANYRHLYDLDVLRALASANEEMTERAFLARRWIAEKAEVRV